MCVSAESDGLGENIVHSTNSKGVGRRRVCGTDAYGIIVMVIQQVIK
jgi:hypothetical protein